MPFRSTAQQRWAFATGQPFAKRWADETDFSGLPVRASRKGRKWGIRRKANYAARAGQTIAGNLVRGSDGKFTSGGGGGGPKPQAQRGNRFSNLPKTAAPKPSRTSRSGRRGGSKGRTAKPKLTPEQRQTARQAERDKNRDAVLTATGLGDEAASTLLSIANGEPGGGDDFGLIAQGLVERDRNGNLRLSSAGRAYMAAANRGDIGAARGALSRGGDRAAAAAAAEQKRRERGGGGGKGKKGDAERQQRQQEVERRRQEAEAQREELRQRELTDLAQRFLNGTTKLSDTELQTLIVNGLAERRGSVVVPNAATQQQARRRPRNPVQTAKASSLAVFKDAAGRYRWITRTTTAYRDRDGEIISTKALEDDAARMTASGQYGPLRWWHVGQPDPFHPAAPWGPGLDIGDCDLSIVVGRTSVESGTFRDAAIAELFATKAAEIEVSPGFFHPVDQPDPAGVFWKIRRFERSLVPMRYGRASNLFTGLTIQEKAMQDIYIAYKALDTQTIDQRLLALKALGASEETIARLAADIQQTDKVAAGQGIAFKSDAGTPPGEIVIGGVVYALKATPQPPAEAEKAPDMSTEGDIAEMEGAADAEMEAGEYVGDMAVADFEAMIGRALQAALGPLVKGLDIAGKMAGHMDELKSMMGGYATKDDARATEITALKVEQQRLAARLAELEGDQPAAPVPSEVEAALKSTGPAAPADAAATVPPGVNPVWGPIFERVARGAGSVNEAFHQNGQS